MFSKLRALHLPRCRLISYSPQIGHIGSSSVFSKVKFQFSVLCPVRRPTKIFKSLYDRQFVISNIYATTPILQW